MNEQGGYWIRKPVSRRRVLRSAITTGAGAVALGAVGCGARSTNKGAKPSAGQPSAPLDSTKGKPGGTLRMQSAGYPGNIIISGTISAANLAGFTHNQLLEYKCGRPIVPGNDPTVEPDLAQALPEQPDQLTYVFKLSAAKFQNGRAVSSEDVKYSFNRYATWDRSAVKNGWRWLDRVETPDPLTAVVKTKYPYADALGAMAGRNDAFILAKEHEEGPDAASKLLGSGPYLFDQNQPPVQTTFKRNPDYFQKPYPYFDRVEFLGDEDVEKKLADFIGRNVDVTYYQQEEGRDRFKKARPDAFVWSYTAPALEMVFRTDKPPFNDKRVRQALSMATDRKRIREGVSKGEGEPDAPLSVVHEKTWGFRKPSELGAAAKYWDYDPRAAKQLLQAAGVSLPLEATWTHWDATHGQTFVDTATLAIAQWREAGIANIKQNIITFAQWNSTAATGNYDGMAHITPGWFKSPIPGTTTRDVYWSPPEGVQIPTRNYGHINDQQLSALLDKQMGQFSVDERKATFREIGDLLAEQLYYVPFSTYSETYFGDPSLRNAQVPWWSFGGPLGWVRYWWKARAAPREV